MIQIVQCRCDCGELISMMPFDDSDLTDSDAVDLLASRMESNNLTVCEDCGRTELKERTFEFLLTIFATVDDALLALYPGETAAPQ